VENNIGVCYGHLGNAKSAASWCERAIAVDPNRPEPVHNLARLHLEMNRPKIATEVLVSFAQRTPFNVDTSFLLAVATYNSGNLNDAMNELVALVGREDAPANAFSFLGVLVADELDDPERSVSVLREGYRRYPDDLRIANNFAYALLLAGHTADAR